MPHRPASDLKFDTAAQKNEPLNFTSNLKGGCGCSEFSPAQTVRDITDLPDACRGVQFISVILHVIKLMGTQREAGRNCTGVAHVQSDASAPSTYVFCCLQTAAEI